MSIFNFVMLSGTYMGSQFAEFIINNNLKKIAEISQFLCSIQTNHNFYFSAINSNVMNMTKNIY